MAQLRIVVGIATTGRPDAVAATLSDLEHQTRPADRVVVSVASEEDLYLAALPPGIRRVIGPKGLTRQRNTILDAIGDEDVVLFLDDDFLMAPDFLEVLEALFLAHPDVAVMTGDVLADGILGAGLSPAEGRAALHASVPAGTMDVREVNNAYGCNMAFRLAPIRDHGLRFDERLPLYGWLEDVDFSRKVAAHGRSVKAEALRGVHLGVKSGRTSGIRLGYSQIANPVYLTRQRTMRPGHAMSMMGRNLLANLVKSVWAEPWVDRSGRLRGNLIALSDLLRGRLDPERVLTLEARPDARN